MLPTHFSFAKSESKFVLLPDPRPNVPRKCVSSPFTSNSSLFSFPRRPRRRRIPSFSFLSLSPLFCSFPRYGLHWRVKPPPLPCPVFARPHSSHSQRSTLQCKGGGIRGGIGLPTEEGRQDRPHLILLLAPNIRQRIFVNILQYAPKTCFFPAFSLSRSPRARTAGKCCEFQDVSTNSLSLPFSSPFSFLFIAFATFAFLFSPGPYL